MIFSYIDRGAGSKGDSVRPAFPTTVLTSGILATAMSNCCKTRLFSSTPECGIEVGINRKEPSFKEGINSLPVFFMIKNPAMTINVGMDKNNALCSKHQPKIRV